MTAPLTTKTSYTRSTGFLAARRTLKNGATLSTTDLLATFTPDAHGNVKSEAYYGGDTTGQALSTSTPFTTPASATYAIDHTISYSSAGDLTGRSSAYNGTTFNITDEDYDASTGLLTTSRDAAGLTTTYTYDARGRLGWIRPEGSAYTNHSYTEATASSAARIDVVQYPKGTTNIANAAELTRTEFLVDELGRVVREKRRIPADGATPVYGTRRTHYDATGRTDSVSTTENSDNPAHQTSYLFDAFGRPTAITSPDGKVTTIAYSGIRTVTRTASVATTDGAADVSTQERFDDRGRLKAVVENFASAPITTQYSYDAADRITSVCANVANLVCGQTRSFVYDGRGVLTSETHPESGTTSYSLYDARVHAHTRVAGGKTLTFTFDTAERLTGVTETVTGTTRALKTCVFGTENGTSGGINDYRKGKLWKAERFNWLPAGTMRVTETYTYASPNGQASSRHTAVDRMNGSVATPLQTFSLSSAYDDLGQPVTLTLPTCTRGNCSTAGQLATIGFTRSNGLLSGVTDFASKITYHPSGMVSGVTHSGTSQLSDTYDVADGIARPSKVTFSGAEPCAAVAEPSLSAPASVTVGSTGNVASVTDAGLTYRWTIVGGTLTSPDNSLSVTFSAPTNTTITLFVTATNSCGRSSSASATIGVSCPLIATPVITAPAAVVPGSTGNEASVTSQPGVTFGWQIVGGTPSSATGASITFAAPAQGSVTLTVTAADACGNSQPSAPKTVAVCPALTNPVVSAPASVAAGSAGNQANVQSQSGFTYSWSISAGTITAGATTTQVTFTAPPAGSFTLTVTAKDACDRTMPATVTIVSVPPPPAAVSATTTANTTVAISWSAVAGAQSYIVERSTTRGGVAAAIANVTATGFVDTVPASAQPATYVYRVRSVGAGGFTSAPGASDYATTASALFARTVGAGIAIAASDVAELRQGANALRLAAGLPTVFNGGPVAGENVLASDINDVAAAINAAREIFGYAGVAAPLPGQLIYAAHVLQLREVLK